MMLNDLLQGVNIQQKIGNQNPTIQKIIFDSRELTDSSITNEEILFVALKGTKVNGHFYIPEVLKKGVKTIVCNKIPERIEPNITYIEVEDTSKALGIIADNFYQNASKKLIIIGVTGTNGKTSIVHLLYQLFQKLGYRVSMISSIVNKIHDQTLPSFYTTPDAVSLHEYFYKSVEVECTHCFMEVSSHAIVQHRVYGIPFHGAIFTNITHEHLDYHKTFLNYMKAKKRLFDELSEKSFALYNWDDQNSKYMIQNTKATIYSFGIRKKANFNLQIQAQTLEGLELILDNQSVWTRLRGEFNAYNLLTVYAVACLLKEESQKILLHLSDLKPIQGRLEHVKIPKREIHVIVDYAHTSDAITQLLRTIRKMIQPKQKLITVIGCGGNRDVQKRPIMGKIAVEQSDYVVFTSDNPRDEDPGEIIQDMIAGIDQENKNNYWVELDRKKAIQQACGSAKAEDVVVIAGKGHETHQEIKRKKLPLSDQGIIREMIRSI